MKEKLSKLIEQLQNEYILLKNQEIELVNKRSWCAAERAEVKKDLLLNVIGRLIKLTETV